MTEFKLTLISGLVVEHFAYSMLDAIRNTENQYDTTVIKAEIAQFTSNKYRENESEFTELGNS